MRGVGGGRRELAGRPRAVCAAACALCREGGAQARFAAVEAGEERGREAAAFGRKTLVPHAPRQFCRGAWAHVEWRHTRARGRETCAAGSGASMKRRDVQ